MLINSEIRKQIQAKPSADLIEITASKSGMRTLRVEGEDLVQRKITSKDEVLRVLGSNDDE